MTAIVVIVVIMAIVIGFILTCNILGWSGLVMQVDGPSMEPTLHDSDLKWCLPICGKIKRYDVVLFNRSGKGTLRNTLNAKTYGQTLVKRIIGLPGETVAIRKGRVYINGAPLKDDVRTYIVRAGKAQNPIVLGPDEYFVLGDNRNEAADSRVFGPVKREYIVRRVLFAKLQSKSAD